MDEAPLVLLVDDDLGIQQVMQSVIEFNGYRVAVTDGDAALTEARRLHPDVVLLDIHMPRISGTDLYRQLARDPATTAIPVVLTSAVYDLPSVARKLGAASYLQKPYDMRMLADKIDPLIAAHRATRSQGETK